jgi:uncharacterized protein YjiS (DUF1127 family)
MQLFSIIETTFRRWAIYGEVRRELGAYSERELADLGIRRSEIAGIAREAAARIQPNAKKHGEAFGKVAQAN